MRKVFKHLPFAFFLVTQAVLLTPLLVYATISTISFISAGSSVSVNGPFERGPSPNFSVNASGVSQWNVTCSGSSSFNVSSTFTLQKMIWFYPVDIDTEQTPQKTEVVSTSGLRSSVSGTVTLDGGAYGSYRVKGHFASDTTDIIGNPDAQGTKHSATFSAP